MIELPEGMTGPALIAMGEWLIALGRSRMEAGSELDLEALNTEIPLSKEEPRLRRQEPRSVGIGGVIVNEGIALARARELGTFTWEEFAAAACLKRVQAMHWLSVLLDDGHVERQGRQFISREGVHPRDWIVKQTESFAAKDLAQACQIEPSAALALLRDFKYRGIVREVDTTGMWAYVPAPTHGPRVHPTKTPPEKIPPNRVDSLATGEPVRVKATQKATRRQRSVSGAGGIKGAKATDRRHDEMVAKREERAAQRAGKSTTRDPQWEAKAARRKAKRQVA